MTESRKVHGGNGTKHGSRKIGRISINSDYMEEGVLGGMGWQMYTKA